MRFGGPVFADTDDPELWVRELDRLGYTAAYCPVDSNASEETVAAFKKAARDADIVIAEVGAWSNPLSSDDRERKLAREQCSRQLDLADRIGARCCVNISGSRGRKWDGPDEKNLTEETFQMTVESVREIIDAVKPERTFYTLETMPWAYPDSTESYARLIDAIDRPQFGVHFDPANLVNSPQRYFNNAALIEEFVERLGQHIRSVHAKDIRLGKEFMTHLDEVRPGTGNLDYRTLLDCLDRLDRDVCLMMEHLPTAEEYDLAADYIRAVAESRDIEL